MRIKKILTVVLSLAMVTAMLSSFMINSSAASYTNYYSSSGTVWFNATNLHVQLGVYELTFSRTSGHTLSYYVEAYPPSQRYGFVYLDIIKESDYSTQVHTDYIPGGNGGQAIATGTVELGNGKYDYTAIVIIQCPNEHWKTTMTFTGTISVSGTGTTSTMIFNTDNTAYNYTYI